METTSTRRHLYNDMAVEVPEGTHGSVTVERFTVERNSLENMRLAFQGGRDCLPGTYTRLMRGNYLWMSDTTAERHDHLWPAMEIAQRGGRVLIGGLGLGMIVRVALLTPEVTHVDVVEIDPDVVALVGPHYEELAAEHGKTLTIHQADVYELKWPPGTRWEVAWFDVWPDLCTDNLEQMAKLRRSYGRRTDWNDCWGRQLLLAERRRDAGRWW